MRKCRFIVTDLPAEIYESVVANHRSIFNHLTTLEIALPTWASMLLLLINNTAPKIDIAAFDNNKDFFSWYGKILANHPDSFTTATFIVEDNEWRHFMPPTLIGVNLRTKLR